MRLKFLCGAVLGTTLGNKITPKWMLCSQGTFPVFPAWISDHHRIFLYHQGFLIFLYHQGFLQLYHNSVCCIFDVSMDAQVGLFKGVKEHPECPKPHAMMLLFFQFREKQQSEPAGYNHQLFPYMYERGLKPWLRFVFTQGMV